MRQKISQRNRTERLDADDDTERLDVNSRTRLNEARPVQYNRHHDDDRVTLLDAIEYEAPSAPARSSGYTKFGSSPRSGPPRNLFDDL